MGSVRLVVVVVVVEVLPAVSEAVPCATGGQVLDVRVHGADELVGARCGPLEAAVDGIGRHLPNQRVEGFAGLPIGIEAIHQSFHLGFALAEVGVDAGSVFSAVPVHGLVQQINANQRGREMVIAGLKLGICLGR